MAVEVPLPEIPEREAPKGVKFDPAKAKDIGKGLNNRIAITCPVSHLASLLIETAGKRKAIIATRKGWKQVARMKCPKHLLADAKSKGVKNMVQAFHGMEIPVYIAEGAENISDCIQEINYFFPQHDLIRLVHEEERKRFSILVDGLKGIFSRKEKPCQSTI